MILRQITLLLGVLLWLPMSTLAQITFDYSYSQSTSTYADLSTSTSLFSNMAWDEEETSIPIGFSFTFMGASFDSVIVNSDGFITFDDSYQYVAAANYHDLQCRQFTDQSISAIGYSLSGSTGSQILKIEFKKCAQYAGSHDDQVSFQIWLHEADNAIEYHFGNSVVTDPLSSYDDNSGAIIGILNMSLTDPATQSGLMLTGNPATATSIAQNGSDRLYIGGTPASGTVYRFIPN